MSQIGDTGSIARWGADAVDPEERSLPGLKMKYLLDRIEPSGKLLEIGSGNGKVLRTLARHRRGLELHGCDVRGPDSTPDCYDFHLMTEDIPSQDASFDVVLLFDVLEHVPDPRHTLEEAARVLKPGGRLIACIPVEGQRLSFYELFRRLFGRDTYAITKEHIQAFTRRGLTAMLAERFHVTDVRYAYHTFGQFMDAAFFAAAKLAFVRRFWWEKNIYYNPGTRSGLVSSIGNRALRAANAVAWAESVALGRCRLTSAAVLIDAEVFARSH
jgi:2-polyprenyl-3-methyl-5-hydroxy-6-metoxy-1,4-benzoquinol methylase